MKELKFWSILTISSVLVGVLFALSPWSHIKPNKNSANSDEQIIKIQNLQVQAIKLISEKDYEKAVEFLIHIDSLNPYDQFSAKQLSNLNAELGTMSLLKIIKNTIKFDHYYLHTDRLLGSMYFHSSSFVEASKHISAYLQSYPEDLPALFYKGAIASAQGNHKHGVLIMSKVIAKAPSYYFAYVELQKSYEALENTEMVDRMKELALINNPMVNKNGICCGIANGNGD